LRQSAPVASSRETRPRHWQAESVTQKKSSFILEFARSAHAERPSNAQNFIAKDIQFQYIQAKNIEQLIYKALH
jgi:hypothetical protein